MAYLITRSVADKNNYLFGFNPSPEFDYYQGRSQLYFFDLDYGQIHNYKYNETPPWITNIYEEKYTKTTHANGDYVEYQFYQPEIFDIPDNTKIIVRSFQDARYYNISKIKEWLKFNQRYEKIYKKNVDDLGGFDDDLCIINVRGGEYRGVPRLILDKSYWQNAINTMKSKNNNMEFIAISDDPEYARAILDYKIPVHHFDIGADYYCIYKAKNLILSNSSFAIFPAWLNENNPFVIAPRFWARHNVSLGYWAGSDMWTFPFHFLDRDGKLYYGENAK